MASNADDVAFAFIIIVLRISDALPGFLFWSPGILPNIADICMSLLHYYTVYRKNGPSWIEIQKFCFRDTLE